jgi:hypothetical protein
VPDQGPSRAADAHVGIPDADVAGLVTGHVHLELIWS